MLSPEYIDHLPDRVVELYADLEIRILEDMALSLIHISEPTRPY